jgi:hypothetical protein
VREAGRFSSPALRICLVLVCSALVAIGLAPAAAADAPAVDQYGSALPSGGNGGGGASKENGPRPGSSGDVSHGDRSVPDAASSTAGNGWVLFFLVGLAVLAALAGALAYRSRRRTAQG